MADTGIEEQRRQAHTETFTGNAVHLCGPNRGVERGWLFEGKSADAPMKDAENSHLKVLNSSGLAFVLYDFRHTAATRWAERGMGVETIAKLLGHANLRTVMRYVHLSQEHLDRSILLYGSAPVANQVRVHESGIFDDSLPVRVSRSKLQ